jgi:hypothetical protein
MSMAACITSFGTDHGPAIETSTPGYWIWFDDGQWHLRTTSGGRSHRFQGSIVGLSGSVTDMRLSSPALAERAALVGDAIQFDFESDDATGIDARVAGGCVRFDLYFDGKHRPDHVRVGVPARAPDRVPFDRCPTD